MEKFMEMMMLPFMKMMIAKVHGWGSPPILPATRKGPTSWLVQESKTLSPAAANPAHLQRDQDAILLFHQMAPMPLIIFTGSPDLTLSRENIHLTC